MPNIRVRIGSGLLGGIVAGTIYQILQWIYITFQIGVSKYGAIYGSFAALPLFLVWLQASWMIMLFGAEISFASQHVDTYEFEPDALEAMPSFRRLLSLRIAQLCVKTFRGAFPLWALIKSPTHLKFPYALLTYCCMNFKRLESFPRPKTIKVVNLASSRPGI